MYDDNLGVGEALNETGADRKGLIARGGVFIYNSPLYMFMMVVKNFKIHLYIFNDCKKAEHEPKCGMNFFFIVDLIFFT